MQLQPHFLFNTLHGIAMLTDTDPAAAETMAVKLAVLLRATLRLRDSFSYRFSRRIVLATDQIRDRQRVGQRRQRG